MGTRKFNWISGDNQSKVFKITHVFGSFNGSELLRWNTSLTNTPFLLKHIK